MRILLTGATGMVGKNILEHDSASDYEFLTPSSQQLNLLNRQQVRDYISENRPVMVIHAAGVVGGIQANISNPVHFLVDNMQIGLNIITVARELGISQFLNLGSSCMYPRNAQNPLSEELILKGELEPTNEGYALAKVTSARLCEYIHREDMTYQYKTIIPCNLYGRHDKFDAKHSHMIPAVIRKLHEAKLLKSSSVDIWGDGLARREFMYAWDMADFIFYAIPRFSDMPINLNVGLGHDFSIIEYYQQIADVIGYDGNFERDLSKPVGMQQKLIDDTKLKKFGWQATTPLADGIDKTYRFFIESHTHD